MAGDRHGKHNTTQMETQDSIMKKRTGEVRLPSDNKAKK